MTNTHGPRLIGPTLGDSPAPSPSSDDISRALPPDLLAQVRGRVRLLVLLIALAFAFDPLLYLVNWIGFLSSSIQPPAEFYTKAYFQLVNAVAVIASAVLWKAAKGDRVPPSRLLTVGLVYEVIICFVIAITTQMEYFLSYKMLPNMDWVPGIVILFPLVLPGPPRRMLTAAVLSAAMTPLSMGLLDLLGKVQPSPDNYLSSTVHAIFALGFAFMGSRVVYGLGREVARARELGSYHLGELLGRGGMGEVYQATHRMLARPAAIKLIRPDMLNTDQNGQQMAITRFRREAEAAASLRSPHTVELYDFGVTPDNTFYCVMELLDGTDLESLVRKKGPLPPERVIYLLRQVCESLEEAHANGLVHRDIKPANIHVGRLGLRHDFVKVLDFGLVKSVDRSQGEDSLATAQGQFAGTPSYMAPEVAMGEPFDGKADVYAIGCVAWYLLTGRMVFDAPNHMAMILRHMRDTPGAPSEYSEAPIPPALDRVILACLAKSPVDRPSAADLSHRLGQIVTTPWGEDQARAWWTVNRPR